MTINHENYNEEEKLHEISLISRFEQFRVFIKEFNYKVYLVYINEQTKIASTHFLWSLIHDKIIQVKFITKEKIVILSVKKISLFNLKTNKIFHCFCYVE